ncbi:MAG: emp24/gp25L/p24 family protein [Bryobacteraceae bacterium]
MPLGVFGRTVLANTIQRVEPRGYAWWVFRAGAGANISGAFEAAGGDNNDIDVYIGPKDGVLNALNGHGGTLLYQSGKRTSGRFSVVLPDSDEYALALNNRFSFISPKNVRVRAALD